MIHLKFLPIPVSINSAFSHIKRSAFSPVSRCKSPKYILFEQEMNVWRLTHSADVRSARTWFLDKSLITLEMKMFMPQLRLFTKSGDPRKLDADNFIKPMQDILSKMLDFDDEIIFKVSNEKIPHKAKGSWCDVIIDEHKLSLT